MRNRPKRPLDRPGVTATICHSMRKALAIVLVVIGGLWMFGVVMTTAFWLVQSRLSTIGAVVHALTFVGFMVVVSLPGVASIWCGRRLWRHDPHPMTNRSSTS
jgi:hypothetical protein